MKAETVKKRAKAAQRSGRQDAGMVPVLRVVADIMKGKAHCRRSVAKLVGISLGTADRWIRDILAAIPGAKLVREGKTSWLML